MIRLLKKLVAATWIQLKRSLGHMRDIKALVERMVAERHVANRKPNEREKAIAYHDKVAPSWKRYARTSTRSN